MKCATHFPVFHFEGWTQAAASLDSTAAMMELEGSGDGEGSLAAQVQDPKAGRWEAQDQLHQQPFYSSRCLLTFQVYLLQEDFVDPTLS